MGCLKYILNIYLAEAQKSSILGIRGVKQSFKTFNFLFALDHINYINNRSVVQFYKRRNSFSLWFSEYINQMIDIMKSSWDIKMMRLGT